MSINPGTQLTTISCGKEENRRLRGGTGAPGRWCSGIDHLARFRVPFMSLWSDTIASNHFDRIRENFMTGNRTIRRDPPLLIYFSVMAAIAEY